MVGAESREASAKGPALPKAIGKLPPLSVVLPIAAIKAIPTPTPNANVNALSVSNLNRGCLNGISYLPVEVPFSSV